MTPCNNVKNYDISEEYPASIFEVAIMKGKE
jgi:hypothetical protein